MDNKIIDMNEWVRWVLEQHPSQNQITTIKKFWKCHKLEDYEKVFKDKIEREHKLRWDGNDYSNEWVDHKYGWDLDRLFDIQKFVPDCPQLSKVDIGYCAIQDTLNSEKWAPYLQVITEYEKHEVKRCKNPDKINRQNEPHTFRIVKLDLGEFQIYVRQARALYNEDRHIHVINSNTKNLDDELKNGYKVYWDEEQVMFITVPKIKINKSLLKGSVSLQKEKRLYIFNDNNTYGVHTNRYRLPELYYPTNMTEFPLPRFKKGHPTQTPVELLEYLIKTYTNDGETVLDNCMGSGSTGVACVNTNRHFIGIELDEGYFDIAKKRIEEAQSRIKI